MTKTQFLCLYAKNVKNYVKISLSSLYIIFQLLQMEKKMIKKKKKVISWLMQHPVLFINPIIKSGLSCMLPADSKGWFKGLDTDFQVTSQLNREACPIHSGN